MLMSIMNYFSDLTRSLQDDSVVHTLFLIAVNNTAMLKCSVKFETGYNKTHNNRKYRKVNKSWLGNI